MRLILLLLIIPLQCYSQSKNVVECDVFYNMITSNDDIFIMDIRMLDNYQKERITDAYWGGTKESFKSLLLEIDKKSPILLYCEMGKRSKECSKWLKSLGYKNVYELRGGFCEWIKNGYPLDSSPVKQ